jgi:glutaryl-CoA dehydrogenase (non-decarboxylating)
MIDLKENSSAIKNEFKEFVEKEIVPFADLYDCDEKIPPELINKISSAGYFGSFLSYEEGGRNLDMISYGYLNEEFGRASVSVKSLLTVQDMVISSIQKMGTVKQKAEYLPNLISGKTIAAFCLTEPNSGSDAKNYFTTAENINGSFLINGKKRWISFGQIADLFLVIADCQGSAAAFLIDKNTPGMKIKHITGMLGVRASMLADVEFKNCLIPKENILGSIGAGFTFIVLPALNLGRYTIAWGCVGISRASLEASLAYAKNRLQFGKQLIDHQLIQEMITNMIANTKASRLLCINAGNLLEKNHPNAVDEILIAKYFSSLQAVKSSSDAVQILGALGCSSESSVQRYFRDAKIMEIIEGTTQIHQILIAKHAASKFSE